MRTPGTLTPASATSKAATKVVLLVHRLSAGSEISVVDASGVKVTVGVLDVFIAPL